jgi:hypothetical protein
MFIDSDFANKILLKFDAFYALSPKVSMGGT